LRDALKAHALRINQHTFCCRTTYAHAKLTATMVAPKAGFSAAGNAAWLGQLEIIALGAPLPTARRHT